MNRQLSLTLAVRQFAVLALLALVTACGASAGPSPAPTETPTPEASPSPTPVPTATATAIPSPTATPSADWQLVWADEFDAPDGSSPDPERWSFNTGGGGWGNGERQYYTDRTENAAIEDGVLRICAREEEESYRGYRYTSARVVTKNQGDWTYGRFEVRARMPEGQGIWPAIWMLPSHMAYGGWPMGGEIDIMEMLGQNPSRVYGTLHYGNPHTHTGHYYVLRTGETFADDYHVFALEWEPDEIRWYVDGYHYHTQTEWFTSKLDTEYPAPFDRPFHLLLNVAVGGQWPGNPDETTEFPQCMAVDYVRVYQDPGQSAADSSSEAPPLQGLLAPAGIPRETYYAPFPLSIALDGDLKDWEGVPRVTVPEEAEQYPSLSAVTFAAAADDAYLYFMGDVTDHNIVSGEHGTNYWNEDSVEFYVNGTGDLDLTSYRDGVAQITVPALNIGRDPEESVIGGVRGDTVDAQVAAVETDEGYAVEVALPLKNDVWNIRLDHGEVIGFQVHLNGASESSRDLKLIWSASDKSDSSYQDPSVFGELIFFEIGQTEAAKIEPTPGPTAIPVPADAAYKEADLPTADRVADLLERMTLEEKIAQMTLVEKGSIVEEDITRRGIGGLLSGGGGYPEPNTPQAWADMVDGFQERALASRLAIPLIYGVDAVHGHSNVHGAVIFPHNVGLGAAGDAELMERIGRVTAAEMIATGIYWNYAPAVSVPQDIRWGRTYEGYSENTALVSALATAYLRGLQGESLAAPDTALATPKHFVGDGGTAWGSSSTPGYEIDQGVTDVEEATLRAIHLPPYVDAIQAGARSIMISYSSWGGMKMHAQAYLISDVLKGELGFDGFVVSDWGAIDQIADDYYEAVVTAINAGIDMNMVPYEYGRFIATLIQAVENGDVAQERIDDAVRRILTVKFELGLFEHPFSNQSLLAEVGSEEHRALAREAVSKSLVLLKNEENTLPLSKETSSINVAGVGADDIGMQCGGWTIEWQGAMGDITPGTTILEGIQSTVSANTTVDYDPYGHFEGPADVCVAAIGEEPYAEGQGDSDSLSLSVTDKRMLKRLPDQCDKIVVVLISGRPLIVTDYLEGWDGFVAAWLPGTEGQGVADALFGDVTFSGKLPYTWPRSADQLPLSALQESDQEPLFPFGYGLP